ncbi:MAG: hypothetical protein NXI24_21005 [bacterium]|nr:hypothetical protein [bacterium]
MGGANAYTQLRAPVFAAASIIIYILIGATACVPALPGQCDSCSYVAALIQNPVATADSPTTTPTAASQGTACSLNAGTGTISDSESGFEITSAASGGPDGAIAIVADYDSIYVGGFETVSPGDTAWRVEKRSRVDGALDPAFGTGGVITSNPSGAVDLINDLAIDESGIYLVGADRSLGAANGQWRMEKRDRTTGALIAGFGVGGVVQSNLVTRDDFPNGVAIDASGLYAVGFREVSPGQKEWRIEKRDLTTGNLIPAFNGGGFIDAPAGAGTQTQARSLALDASFMYVVGVSLAGNNQWRIEKRNLSDGALVTAFDGDGVLDSNPGPTSDEGLSIQVDANFVYTSGTDQTGAGQFRIEKRDITTGVLDTAFDTDGILEINPSPTGDRIQALALDTNNIYFAGFDNVAVDAQINLSKYTKAAGTAVTAFDGDGSLQINPTAGNDQFNDLCVDSSFVYAIGDTGTGPAQDWYILKRNRTTGL